MKHTLPAPRGGAGAFHGLEAFRRQFDRLFDDFAAPMRPFGGELMPELDYAETDKDVVVTVELAGVDPKDVDISLTEGALAIRGEKRSERDEKKANYRLTERIYGSFERAIRIPDGVDPDRVTADFENGVLKVTLPKSEAVRAKSRKIEIKSTPQ